MIRTTLKTLAVLVLAGLVHGAVSGAADAPAAAGLLRVPSHHLDEFQLRPDAGLARYRGVLIDPALVSMHEEWLKDMNYRRASARRIGADEAKRISDDAATSLRTALAGAFRARGFEIAAAPGPGVLRLSPRIAPLYVNAPEALASGTTKLFIREAGEATLILEARDSSSGVLLARVVHRDRASTTGGFSRASDVSNRFWFDVLFSRWAANCASEFVATR